MPRRALSEKLNNLLHFDFQQSEVRLDDAFTEEDLLAQLQNDNKTSTLFLGQYTMDQIMYALNRFEILPKIHNLGYEGLEVEFEPRTAFEHRMTIRCENSPVSEDILGEIIVKDGYFRPKVHYFEEFQLDSLDLIFIEWILMQQLGGQFEPERPRLPGQNWPGLGVGHSVMELLRWTCKHAEKDGVLNFPEYYHNGLFYSKQFYFYNPGKQAELLAIFRDLSTMGLSVADISFAAYFDCIVDLVKNEPYKWKAEEQIYPVSKQICDYFARPAYQTRVEKQLKELKFGLDRKRYEQKSPKREELQW